MSKERLIHAIADQFTSVSAAERAIDTVIDGIERVVKKGEHVTIRGFGSFQARDRKGLTVRNPRTGEAMTVPPRKALTFTSKVRF